MNIIAVDDERHALISLEQAIRDVVRHASLTCFSSALEALEHARIQQVDVAFLDIEMPQMHGLQLARRLKDIYGGTNIIFVTGYSNYLKDAFTMHASGYLFKPIGPEQVKTELENLRIPPVVSQEGVRIQCFGSFNVFVDGRTVFFKRTKAKEALAYLIDRKGASVSKKELAAVLWEDRPYTHSVQSHLYLLITEMIRTLKAAGADDIIIKARGLYCVDTSKVDCDYYNYEKGIVSAVNSYHGEYMSNYSWAEFTVGFLDKHR